MTMASMFVGLFAMTVAWALVAPAVSPAAGDQLLETRTLYMTERFTPAGVPRGPVADTFPEQMQTLQGEREGFQLAINNTTGADLHLAARIAPDNALGSAYTTGTLGWEFLRAAFTNVSTASSRVESSAVPGAYTAGTYEDALPPLREDSDAGLLAVPAGQWGGVVSLFKIRTDAPAGTYGGELQLVDPKTDTVYARQPFTVTVHNRVLRQGGEKNSFKTVMHVEGDQYWLADPAMRNGKAGGFPTAPDRMLQLQGLMSFLDSRGVSLNEQPFGNPAANGTYTCDTYTSSPGNLAPTSYLTQVTQRYFGLPRDISPGTQQFPTRMFPSETDGCNPSDPVGGGYNAKIDKFHTPGIKQDDILHPGAGAFFNNIAAAWAANGMFNGSTYVKNPFDEPSDVTKNMKYQYLTQVPKANMLLHAALKGRAKVVLADWPRDNTNKRVCHPIPGHGKSCTTLSGDGFSNRYLWDGKGSDDTDVWLAPFSRLFGRPVSTVLRTKYKVNRDRMYADRLAGLKRLRGGREVWAYNFYTGNALQPQLTIDAPSTDARMNYWILAREGHTGLFVSNTILGWGSEVKTNTDGTRRKGNPWDGVTYFQHSVYGHAAGWGTFLYPGYNPRLGLSSEADRNSADSRPVTTLRMEGMRDGQEDGDLMLMYRDQFGQAGINAITKAIFPGTYRELPSKLGHVTFPRYSNTGDLAQRMERQRRAMIAALAP
jgi:hypothetical protein